MCHIFKVHVRNSTITKKKKRKAKPHKNTSSKPLILTSQVESHCQSHPVTRFTSVLWWNLIWWSWNTASTQLDQKERGGVLERTVWLINYQLKLSLRLRTVLHMKPKLTHDCTSYSFMDFWCLFADNGKHGVKILRDVTGIKRISGQ